MTSSFGKCPVCDMPRAIGWSCPSCGDGKPEKIKTDKEEK